MTATELKERMDKIEERHGTRCREDVLISEIIKLNQRLAKLEAKK